MKRDIQHNNAQHNAEHCYAECQLCSVSFMLSVINKPFILTILMLNVIMLSVVMLNVVVPFEPLKDVTKYFFYN